MRYNPRSPFSTIGAFLLLLIGLLWQAVKGFIASRLPPSPQTVLPDPPLPPDEPTHSKLFEAGLHGARFMYRDGTPAPTPIYPPRPAKPAPEDALPTLNLKDLSAQATIIVTFRDDLRPINAGYPVVAPTFQIPPPHIHPRLN